MLVDAVLSGRLGDGVSRSADSFVTGLLATFEGGYARFEDALRSRLPRFGGGGGKGKKKGEAAATPLGVRNGGVGAAAAAAEAAATKAKKKTPARKAKKASS